MHNTRITAAHGSRGRVRLAILLLALLALAAGCGDPEEASPASTTTTPDAPKDLQLASGVVIQTSVPSASKIDEVVESVDGVIVGSNATADLRSCLASSIQVKLLVDGELVTDTYASRDNDEARSLMSRGLDEGSVVVLLLPAAEASPDLSAVDPAAVASDADGRVVALQFESSSPPATVSVPSSTGAPLEIGTTPAGAVCS